MRQRDVMLSRTAADFRRGYTVPADSATAEPKAFCFFFSKKKAFFLPQPDNKCSAVRTRSDTYNAVADAPASIPGRP